MKATEFAHSHMNEDQKQPKQRHEGMRWRVGQVMQHVQYDYSCVIIGWDPEVTMCISSMIVHCPMRLCLRRGPKYSEAPTFFCSAQHLHCGSRRWVYILCCVDHPSPFIAFWSTAIRAAATLPKVCRHLAISKVSDRTVSWAPK